MIRGIIISLLILNFVGMVYADVGPSPEPPKVTVNLVSGNAPATDINEIVYHCYGESNSSDSVVSDRLVALPCNNGICKNSDSWFYKLNPCFSFPYGYFSYQLNGIEKQTEIFNISEGQSTYDMTFDVQTGELKSSTYTSGFCIAGFVLLGLVCACIGR